MYLSKTIEISVRWRQVIWVSMIAPGNSHARILDYIRYTHPEAFQLIAGPFFPRILQKGIESRGERPEADQKSFYVQS